MVNPKANHPSLMVIQPAYRLIASSPRLRQAIIPEGLQTSPYEVLDYDATLVLHDDRGAKATFQRKQRIRFTQDGVAAILDHAWGDGIILTNYWHSAGALSDTFKEQGHRHLVVDLKRAMGRGEILSFDVERQVMESFTRDHGTVETVIDHPIENLRRSVIFPKQRPVLEATLRVGDEAKSLPIVHLADGRTAVIINVAWPQAHVTYAVEWAW